MKKLFFLLASLLYSSTQLFAQQSWQWGKRGGGSHDLTSGGTLFDNVQDMTLDGSGNIYVLSNIDFTNQDVDVANYTLPGRSNDIVVSSFTCNGIYRWSKVIGSTNKDIAVSLRSDTLGGIYISGRTYSINTGDSTFFSTDSKFGQSYKTWFIAKYDTAGNYKWNRYPQPDTVSSWTLSQGVAAFDMDVDKEGNSYSLCYLAKGAYGGTVNTYFVDTPAVHMIRYDKNGTFLGGNSVDISYNNNSSPVSNWKITRTKSGKFIVNGAPVGYGVPLSFGSTVINRRCVVACFNSNGTSNWVTQGNLPNTPPLYGGGNTFLTKASLDAQGNLYMAGSGDVGDGLGAFTFSNPGVTTGISFPIVCKLDSNGSVLWVTNATTQGTSIGGACTLNSNGELFAGGSWSGTLRWPGSIDSISHTFGWSPHVFIAKFNAQTGAYIKMDTLYSPPSDFQQITNMTADKKGNVYLGGSFKSEIKVASTSLYAKPGGFSDFLVAKYGAPNCNCIAPPVASLMQLGGTNNTSRTATFQYTGTTTNLDSLVWDWGNGQRQIVTGNYGAALTHQYSATDTGAKNVCVTAHDKDCYHSACKSIYFSPVGIAALNASGGVSLQLAPNPSITETQVGYTLAGNTGNLEVYDLTGRMFFRKLISQKSGIEKLSLTEYVPGLYLVVLREGGEVVLHQRLSVVR